MNENDEPAWQTRDGVSIMVAVSREAEKRGLALEEIIIPMKVDPKARNALMIEGQRCQVLPGRLLDPGESPGEQAVRLHPAYPWDATFFVYVVKGYPITAGHSFFILPANKQNRGGVWEITLKLLSPYWDAWNLLKTGRKLVAVTPAKSQRVERKQRPDKERRDD